MTASPGRPRRIIVGLSGASGVIYGIRLLQVLHEQHPEIETHLVASKAAERTIVEETDWSIQDVRALASVVYPIGDIGAAIASGSFRTEGMVVIPCSIHTAGAIANCVTDTLLTRAADVCLKERRRLVLVVRETPFHLGHLRVMTALAEAGAVILPPVPAFYSRPKTLDDIINHTVGRVLDHFGVPHDIVRRWGEPESGSRR
ncbi:MAG TPA: UbiX family flavin prenyltransferase [Thermodesulfobacteriota bacterium]|nr:UbiX family flavin prenyltransferase [Thermodesulfobacteriota bacterium]